MKGMVLMVIDKLKGIFAEQFGVDEDEISDDANVIEDYCTSELERVDVAMAIEDKFGISITEDELSEFSSISEIADFVDQSLL